MTSKNLSNPPSADPTLRERLEAIRIPITCQHCGAVDYKELPPETEAQLQSLCQEIAREARLDELSYFEPYTTLWKRTAPMPDEKPTIQLVSDRIAELTHKPQGDSRE